MSKEKAPAKANMPKSLTKFIPFILVIGGIVGLICSFIIAYDEFHLIQNPHFQVSCDLNPVVSCGSVMQSDQAHAFGFPNPWIGLICFPILITIGVSMWAGAKFKRWFWIGLELGIVVVGMAFAYWLLFESVYRIQALCPYCLTVDVVVTVVFWYVTLYNFEQKYLMLPKSLAKVPAWLRRHHLDILVLWFIIIIALILKHFWYYYGKHLF